MQIVPIVCALSTTIPALVALWGFYGAVASGFYTGSNNQQQAAVFLGYFGFMLALFRDLDHAREGEGPASSTAG